MQFKTAIILSVLTAASTTFAAPIHPHKSALSRRDNHDAHHHHYARDLEEVQEIQARSPSPDIEEFERRSPQGMGGSFQMTGGGYGGAAERPAPPRGMVPNMTPSMLYSSVDGSTPRRKSGPHHYRHYARSLPEYTQELMERGPLLEFPELKTRSPQLGEMGFHPSPGQRGTRGNRREGERRKGRKGRKGMSDQFFKQPFPARSPSGDVQELKARSLSIDEELAKRSEWLKQKLSGMVNGPNADGIRAKLHRKFGNGGYNTGGWTPGGRKHYSRSFPEDGQVLESRSPFYELDDIDD